MMIEPHTLLLTTPFTDPPAVADPQSNPALGHICKNLVTPKCVVPTANVAKREKLFSFTCGKDIEQSSGKSAWEIYVETLERVQYLNRRIALHDRPSSLYDPCREKIERSGKFHYFLIRVAGIAGGPVAAAKFMDDPRNDRRVRDYLAEHECPNHLIESITLSEAEQERCDRAEHGKVVKRLTARTKEATDKPQYYRFVELHRTATAKEPDYLANTTIGKRFQQVTPEDVAWGERQASRGPSSPRTAAQKRLFAAKCQLDEKLWCKTCEDWVEQAVVDEKGIAREHECEPAFVVRRFYALRCDLYLKTAAANDAARQIKYTGGHVNDFNPGYGRGIGTASNDRSSHNECCDAAYFAKRPERYVGRTLTMCLRPSCGGRFMATREGQKYCSKNCCNRHGEELKLIKENTCQQALLLEHQVVVN